MPVTTITPQALDAHELRNPLNGVMHNVRFVAEEAKRLLLTSKDSTGGSSSDLDILSKLITYLDSVQQKIIALLSLINIVLGAAAAKAQAAKDAKAVISAFASLELTAHQVQEKGIADECVTFCNFVLQPPVELTKCSQLIKVANFVEAIQNSAHHLKKIATNYCEQPNTTIRDVFFDAEAIIQEVIWMHAAQAKMKGLKIEIIFPIGEISKFLLDVQSFKQVLINLLANAIHHTAQGTITVEFGIVKQTDTTTTLQVSVSDTGCGMSPEICAQLGQPYFQGDKNKTAGTGLGLSICKRFLAEKLNGTLAMSSEVGKGSIFTFTVSGQKHIAEISAQIQQQPSAFSKTPDEKLLFLELKDKKILIAEDDKTNQNILKRLLENEGAVCEWARNGQEAIVFYHSFKPDIILMDFLMPKMDGIAAAKEIRKIETGTKIPIIGLSASNAPDVTALVDMDAFLTKPYVKNDICKKIVELLNKKRLVSTPSPPTASPEKSPDSPALSPLVSSWADCAVVCTPPAPTKLLAAPTPPSPPSVFFSRADTPREMIYPTATPPSTPPSPTVAALVVNHEFSHTPSVVCAI